MTRNDESGDEVTWPLLHQAVLFAVPSVRGVQLRLQEVLWVGMANAFLA